MQVSAQVNQFEPLSRSSLDQSDHVVFQTVANHVQDLLGSNWHPITNVEQLEGVPSHVKTAWYVWWFAAEVGGSGVPDYLRNHVSSMHELKACWASLHQVGATELAAVLEEGIALTADDIDAAVTDNDRDWMGQFFARTDEATIEEKSFQLCGEPLSHLVASFLREHWSAPPDGA